MLPVYAAAMDRSSCGARNHGLCVTRRQRGYRTPQQTGLTDLTERNRNNTILFAKSTDMPSRSVGRAASVHAEDEVVRIRDSQR